MLDRPSTALVMRTKWVRVPPPALANGEDAGVERPSGRRQPDLEAGSTPAGLTDSSVEQPGVLAALTSRRSLVQIQPGLLSATPVAQRRRHLPDVEAFTAGSSPAGGTAEWTGVRPQHGLISRSHAGSNPASATRRSGGVAAARRPGKRGRPGSSPGRTSWGLLVQQEAAVVARRKSGCDSPAVHSSRR